VLVTRCLGLASMFYKRPSVYGLQWRMAQANKAWVEGQDSKDSALLTLAAPLLTWPKKIQEFLIPGSQDVTGTCLPPFSQSRNQLQA
jgi:hypothetical protein